MLRVDVERFFALVVMVMPCGLTPVEGIDSVNWFYFSMYACAHVRPTQTHTQTNVQYGAFEEWSLTETSTSAAKRTFYHPPPRRHLVHVQTEEGRRGRHLPNIQGTACLPIHPLSPPSLLKKIVTHLIYPNRRLDALTETVGGFL